MKSKRLPPLFGIRPGIYITGFFLLLLLIILFLLLFLPGILNYGSKVAITSDAVGAAVYINGKLSGSTPLEIFIPKGVHDIHVIKPYFEQKDITYQVGGRAFFSLFAPRRQQLDLSQSLEDPAGYLSWRLQDLYDWSLITNYSETYQYPQFAERTARNISSFTEEIPSELLNEFFSFLPYLASSSVIEDDISAGFSLLSREPPQQPSATQIPDEVHVTDVYTLQDQSIEFIGFSGEGFDTFYLSSSLIRLDQFDQFTDEQEQWRGENRNELIEKALVDDTYLYSQQNITSAAVNVSYYAAQAYTQWLDELYPQYTIKLPDALQWETAAQGAGKNQMMGLWQWTDSKFYPGFAKDYLKQPENLALTSHYLLKGGPDNGTSDSPAALAPSVCSPVTGFRLVLIKD